MRKHRTHAHLRSHRRPESPSTAEHLRRLIMEVLQAPVPPRLKTWTRI